VTALIVSLFTLVVALISITLLASTLTQGRLSSLTIDGVSLTVWKLNFVYQNWEPIQNQIEKQSEALVDAEIRRTHSDARSSAAKEKFGVLPMQSWGR
jgi:hypothetical protein